MRIDVRIIEVHTVHCNIHRSFAVARLLEVFAHGFLVCLFFCFFVCSCCCWHYRKKVMLRALVDVSKQAREGNKTASELGEPFHPPPPLLPHLFPLFARPLVRSLRLKKQTNGCHAGLLATVGACLIQQAYLLNEPPSPTLIQWNICILFSPSPCKWIVHSIEKMSVPKARPQKEMSVL